MTGQSTGTAHHLVDEAEQLREESADIERLLDEVRAKAGPGTWPLVEQAVQRIVSLYGAGLERLLSHAIESGAAKDALRDRVCADELLSSLLVLHGLHPLSLEERVRRALDRVRPYLGSHAGDVELLGITDQQTVQLRLLGTCHGCASSQATVQHLLRRAIEEAAPEVMEVHVDGTAKASTGSVVQLNVKREARDARPVWTPVDGLERLASGQSRLVDVSGMRILALRLGETLLAYRDGCPGCGESLERATLKGDALACSGCACRYDVLHAGGRLDGPGRSLQPVPLLADQHGVRVSLVGVAS